MRVLFVLFLMILSSCSSEGASDILEQYMWEKRLVLVFSPNIDNLEMQEQYKVFKDNEDGIKERDIVTWIFINNEKVIVGGEQKPHLYSSPFYKKFQVDDNDFVVIVIGKDGYEKLRIKNKVATSDSIFSLIDSMPMRKKEMLEK
jgi:hypothetical protein